MVCSCRDEKLKLKPKRLEFFCDPGRIQTCNLLIRSQMLYSVELRDRFSFDGAKVRHFFYVANYFAVFLLKCLFFLSCVANLFDESLVEHEPS